MTSASTPHGASEVAATSAEHLVAAHRAIVHSATLAPSIHNSQPWSFTTDEGGLDVYADSARRLPVLDPEGRLVHLSCGAALQHAQVAARALGFLAEPVLLPDPADPGHLARLTLTTGSPSSPADHELADAISRRHTHRDAFEERALPEALLDGLRLAAEEHHAGLVVVHGDGLVEFSALLARADRDEEADPDYRAETAASIRTAPSDDGIPASALPDDAERGSSLRLRDFTLSGPHPFGGEPPPAEKPDVVLVVTDDDSPSSWLRAGQAVGAVLLQAARDGVMGQPLAQATDLPVGRLRLRRALGLVGVPQMALRLGYAAGTASTPRRPVDDVLRTQPMGTAMQDAAGALRVWESEGGHLRAVGDRAPGAAPGRTPGPSTSAATGPQVDGRSRTRRPTPVAERCSTGHPPG